MIRNILFSYYEISQRIAPPLSNSDIPILAKLGEVYKIWHAYLQHVPKITRFTLGAKIDNIFTECIDLALLASHQSKEKKAGTIELLNGRFKSLKFFLKLLWETRGMNTNVYSKISNHLAEIGRMIGGWQKYTRK